MSLEFMGLITTMVGLVILTSPAGLAFYFMVLSTVFGAAAALSLPALGGASVLVPNLFLVFFALRLFMAFGEGNVLAALQPPRAGFWLLALTATGLLSAIAFPRIFQGGTETMIVERLAGARSIISLTPLRFSSNNITQSVYALGGLVCFAITFAYFRRAGRPEQIINAMLVVGAVNIGFALADIVTYFTGTEFLLGFVRTANYALLTAVEKGGLKRISGTFPEASAFADYTLVLFAVAASLWLDRVRTWASGVVAALQLAALVLSTSATALIGLAIVLPLLWMRSMISAARTPDAGRPAFLSASLFIILLCALALPILAPALADSLYEFLDEMLFSKANSQSGLERGMWNAMAYQTFLDTYGLGAGLGSARASSYLLVLLSNVGIPGFMLFVIFVTCVFAARPAPQAEAATPMTDASVRAAKTGVVAVLATALVSGTVYDLGLLFYILTGSIAALTATRSMAASARSADPALSLPRKPAAG